MRLKHSLPLLLLILASACASIGLQPATSFTQRLGYAYGTHTSVLQGTTAALDAKEITSTDAEHILVVADQGRMVLDGAKVAFAGGDVTTAEGKLKLAAGILTQLQAYLRGAK